MANLNNALKKLCSDANVIKETYYGSSHRASFTLNGEKSEWDIFHIGIPFSPQKEAELMRRFGLERDDLASFYGNFEKADTKCAAKWNDEGFLGKHDWTAREVTRYRSEYNYTWHECADRKTCQMISRDIHDYFGHSGGVWECKKASAKKAGGGFDA